MTSIPGLKLNLLSLLCCACLLCLSALHAENKVLFIGNSYTLGSGGTHSVPDIFDALANAGGQEDPTTVIRAIGGKNYGYHAEKSGSFIKQMPWTHVVLQNYSLQATHAGSVEQHMKNGARLYDLVIANNPDTQVCLYMTWARAQAHPLISGKPKQKRFESTDEMLSEINENYHQLATALTKAHPENPPVQVNPVGLAWKAAGGNLPASDPNFVALFSQDNHHANDAGYYLSACVHYASIYHASPEGLFNTPQVQALGLKLDAATAAHLEKTAWETVQQEQQNHD